jgi:2-hydroxyglutarate dehydrogenase
MYKRCDEYNIPYRKTGKLVVVHEDQRAYIESLHIKATGLPWPKYSTQASQGKPVLPTELITGEQARELVPDLSKKIVAALWSPETGILDSHAFMESLEKDIMESEGGELVFNTNVVRVDAYKRSNQVADSPDIDAGEDGWVVQTITGDVRAAQGDTMLARNLIISCGLSGPFILNSLLPEQSRIPMYYARGTYASFNGQGISPISRLIYPGPNLGAQADAFHSLGTHLTIDMEGKIRFGPDLEWISPPDDGEESPDFWRKHLVPNDRRLEEMHRAVMDYLPGVKLEGMQPDYVGIRPKLVPPEGGFQDFVFRTDFPNENRRGPLISLLGFESPGLTASLAIAEYVVEDMLRGHGR